MAQAFERSTFVGFDIHEPSIEAARMAAAQAGVSQRARFDVAPAKDFPGRGGSRHPAGSSAGRHAAAGRANAGDALEHKLNPVGRTYYGLSTVICTPGSLAQEVGLGLGAQAGERQLAIVLREAGFTHVRRATETPFNIILEARP